MTRFALFFLCGLPALSGSFSAALQGETIAQWNFNNSILPSYGQGSASLIGGVTATFATGSTNDPSATGNTGWNTTQYPAQGTSTKSAGVQFAVSTLGYTDIVVRWDQRVSNSASKYCRFQYSIDGTHFLDLPDSVCVYGVSPGATYYEPQTVDLASAPDATDNPAFAFRIVTEFESEALPNGAEQYVTTSPTNRYSSAGTIRFDMLTVSGTPIQGTNSPPVLSSVPDQVLRLGQSTEPLPFTVSDAEDPPERLTLAAASSDPRVIPDSNISLSGSDGDRTVKITAGLQPGLTIITLWATDSGGRSGTVRFAVTVLSANTTPIVSTPPGTNLVLYTDLKAVVPFAVADLETPANDLLVSGVSGNPALIPNDATHINFGGTGSNRFVSLTPLPGIAGTAPIILTVSDGVNLTQTSFPFSVTPAVGCVLYEPFSYPDGSVITNSGRLWTTRAGTAGDCATTGGSLKLSSACTEDIVAPLPGGPYEPGHGHVLYTSFKIKFLGAPKFGPEYFAHLLGAGAARARVFAGASEAWTDAFNLYIANGSSTNWPHAAVLSTNTSYTVVTRYDVDSAASALWVNPSSEATPAAIAADPQTPIAITSVGFRQESALGATVLIDDLRAGLSFAAVTANPILPVRLEIERDNAATVLRWNDSGFILQGGTQPSGPYTNLTGCMSPFTNLSSEPQRFFRLLRSP